MSGLQSVGYALQGAAAYGIPGVVDLASPTATYTAKPTDFAILVDVSGYAGAGPTINWCPTPQEDFPVLIRNVAGSVATHDIVVNAPTGMTIEDPGNIGTFAATITLAAASGFEFGVWILDRAKQKLVLFFGAGGGGGGGGGAIPPFALFVDPQQTTGFAADTNTGQTANNVPAGTGPILTTAENNRRAGATLTKNTTTTYLSDDNSGTLALIPPLGGFNFEFLGTPQVIATTTVTALTAINPTAGPPGQAELITTAIGSLLPYVLTGSFGGGTSAFPCFFRVVGGANAGNTAWIGETTTGEGGSNTQAICSRPILSDFSTGGAISNGDTVQICRGCNFSPAGMPQSISGSTQTLTYQFMRFLTSFTQHPDSSDVTYNGCSFDAQLSSPMGFLSSCFVWNVIQVPAGQTVFNMGVYLAHGGDGGETLVLGGDVLVLGGSGVIAGPANWNVLLIKGLQGNGAQFNCDGALAAITCFSDQVLGAHEAFSHALIWGATVATHGILIYPGTTVTVSSQSGFVPTLIGTGDAWAFVVPSASGSLVTTNSAVRATPGPPATAYDGPHSTNVWANLTTVATFNFAAHLLESNSHLVAIPT